jgi:lipoate-protein ligase A
MPRPARLIVDPPAAGAWNMAVDEALMLSAAERGEPTLRLYGWAEPTLSLGYFQGIDERRAHAASRDCPLVRRSSGGGAIVHDRELTYSYAVPVASCRWEAADLYAAFHATLVEVFSSWGVPARLCSVPGRHGPAEEPFLCFQRRTVGDLLVGDAKVVGSAQRRHRRGLLQHGSILWQRSPRAPELPGLLDLVDIEGTVAQLSDQWLRLLNDQLEVEFVAGTLSANELSMAGSRVSDRFGHPGWTSRR